MSSKQSVERIDDAGAPPGLFVTECYSRRHCIYLLSTADILLLLLLLLLLLPLTPPLIISLSAGIAF